MTNEHETFANACMIVEHELDPLGTNGWKKMIDRIRSAHKREMDNLRKNEIESGMIIGEHADIEIEKKDAEILRLRAALKPVLAVNIDGMDSYCRVNCESLLKSIVREAQRIYKEGDNND